MAYNSPELEECVLTRHFCRRCDSVTQHVPTICQTQEQSTCCDKQAGKVIWDFNLESSRDYTFFSWKTVPPISKKVFAGSDKHYLRTRTGPSMVVIHALSVKSWRPSTSFGIRSSVGATVDA
jgi:hypothetical protein